MYGEFDRKSYSGIVRGNHSKVGGGEVTMFFRTDIRRKFLLDGDVSTSEVV